ncbi:MAG: hypothetical protein Q9160_000974 [Pyrenula sp. 1 TL-2023]
MATGMEAPSTNAPQKKHKKSKKRDGAEQVNPAKLPDIQAEVPPALSADVDPSKPKQGARKRAMDFLSDDEDTSFGGVELPSGTEVTGQRDAGSKKKLKKQRTAEKHGVPALVTEELEYSKKHGNKSEAETTIKKTVRFTNEQNGDKKSTKAKHTKQPITEQKKRGPTVSDQMADRFNKLITTDPSQWNASRKNKQTQPSKTGSGALKPNGDASNTVLTKEARDLTSTTLQAEAQELSSDQEASEDDEQDHAPELLAGFDSDSPDDKEDEGLDPEAQSFTMPNYKKTNKKLRKIAAKGDNEGPGTVYVGRIPHGFYEHQMRAYFSQFGTITKLRLSRNRKTGAPKHFAFIQFESREVAKIVAETMDNYLMFGHILKCKFAPEETLHPDVWKGANRRYRPVPHNKIERKRLDTPRTKEQWAVKIDREQKKREAKAEKLKEIGYEIELPKMTSVDEVLKGRTEKLAESDMAQVPIADDAAATTAAQNDAATAFGFTEKLKEAAKVNGEGDESKPTESTTQSAAKIVNDLPTSQRKAEKKQQRQKQNTTKANERTAASNIGAEDTFEGFTSSPATAPASTPPSALTKSMRKRQKRAEKKRKVKAAAAAQKAASTGV